MHEHELVVALDAVAVANAYLLDAYADFQSIPDAPANITTEADRQTQEIILQHLVRAFPGDALCAEENTPTLQGAVVCQLLISTKWPAIAAAIAGETRWVRPRKPCRPSKLRFEIEAQRSPGASLSGFIARNIEQPGSRHLTQYLLGGIIPTNGYGNG